MRVAVAVGLLAGVLSGLSRVHLAGPVDVYVNSIGVWLVPPFLVGLLLAGVPRAVAGGVLASVVQMAAFYAVTRTSAGMVLWFAAALGAGAVCGGAGGVIGARRWASRAVHS